MHTNITLCQDQPTVAKQVETNLVKSSLTSCQLAHFCIGSQTMPGLQHSPPWLHRVMGVCMCRCNLPPALLAEWPGSFTCHCGNTGVEQTSNKSQHKKLTLEKKILPLLLPSFKLATFQSRAWCSYQQAILDNYHSTISTEPFQMCRPYTLWYMTDTCQCITQRTVSTISALHTIIHHWQVWHKKCIAQLVFTISTTHDIL